MDRKFIEEFEKKPKIYFKLDNIRTRISLFLAVMSFKFTMWKIRRRWKK